MFSMILASESMAVTTIDDDPKAVGASLSTSDSSFSWGVGTYTKCTSTPCGALSVVTWNEEAVYVKPSGISEDPSHEWYWAYISKFRPAGYTPVWQLAHVPPRYDANDPDCARDGGWCWEPATYCWYCTEPFGAWGQVTVAAIY